MSKNNITEIEERYNILDKEITFGYIFAVFGGIVGILIAAHLQGWNKSKTNEEYQYREKHFNCILTISFAVLVFALPAINLLIHSIYLFVE